MYKETREPGGSRHSGWKVQGFAQPSWVWSSALLLDGGVNLAGLFDLPKCSLHLCKQSVQHKVIWVLRETYLQKDLLRCLGHHMVPEISILYTNRISVSQTDTHHISLWLSHQSMKIKCSRPEHSDLTVRAGRELFGLKIMFIEGICISTEKEARPVKQEKRPHRDVNFLPYKG